MLIALRSLRRWPDRRLPAWLFSPALLGGLLCLPAGNLPLQAATDPPPAAARAPRPADLVILQRRSSVHGEQEVGVFGARPDPLQPDLWSVQVWEESDDRVTIATDRIRCSPQAPMRITGTASRLLVRELNPGGAIHASNRLDHLIWWAVCHPSLAGRDPAGLTPEARRLGLSGTLPERQEIVPAPSVRRN
ncbi:MAG: hypothetical protein ACKOXO_05210 [Cyanobium sp.]